MAQKNNQTLFSISGQVINSENGAPIAMASFIVNQTIGVITDGNGYFHLDKLKGGEITYDVSFLGYSAVERKIVLNGNIEGLKIELTPLSLELKEVVVTAQSTDAGSTSRIGEEAIRHIQPMSISDMFQLLPGSLSVNPSLNSAAQASIREIGSDGNNALGAAVVVDGAPLSNDGNMQALSTSVAGSASNQSLNGMSDQTTAGKGVDLRSVSPDNVESMEVIRGIPSAEYGNLTSGVVIVKTKAGATPLEAKFKADPYSKLVYLGKGFGLKNGGAVNIGVDYSQSYGDTRKHYLGYNRITATVGYSKGGKMAGRPITMRLNGTFYSNVNNSKTDPQMQITNSTYKNKNIGARLNLEGSWKLNGKVLSAIDYSFMASQSYQSDISHDYIASASGAVTNTLTPGVATGIQLPGSYYSDYEIEGKPLNIYLQLKANKIIQLGLNGSFTNLRVGADWRYDANYGRGLLFDITLPPQNTSSAALRPRSFRNIPALNNFAAFIEDKLNLKMGGTILALTAGVRLTDMFLDKQANQGNIVVAEPRVNLNYSLIDKTSGALALTGGWGLSYKAPTLLHLYPDNVYIDRVSLNKVSSTDATGSMAVMTTAVLTDMANPDLKPARSRKYEGGVRFRIGGVSGQITYFREKHTNEFGFSTRPYYMHYNEYSVPTGASQLRLENGDVHYQLNGEEHVAATTTRDYIATYYTPTNRARTNKEGVEYSIDLGQCHPLRTSLIIDGAWFRIHRTDEQPYYSKLSDNYAYIRYMPAGSGSIQNRVNSNFRFVTHIPKLKLIISTTMQIVWFESQQNIWENSEGKSLVRLTADGKQTMVAPLGFFDANGNYTAWRDEFATDDRYKTMVATSLINAYDREVFKPWVMFNLRLTKEIGRMLELSFTANNFTRTSRWHYYDTRTGYKQVYPDMYFGAELKVRIKGK